ncbi:MAG: leucyl aminopeptidase family protein [Bacteroidota bacterium]
MNLRQITRVSVNDSQVYLVRVPGDLTKLPLDSKELDYIKKQHRRYREDFFSFNKYDNFLFVCFLPKAGKRSEQANDARKKAYKVFNELVNEDIETLAVKHVQDNDYELLAFAEGFTLSSYQFDKYKSKKSEPKRKLALKTLKVISKTLSPIELQEVDILTRANFMARDLVNEPLNHLNAEVLAERIAQECKKRNVLVEVMNKTKIASLKMGGLLAVNKGSVDPPTFTIAEWKPEKYFNQKPIVLVGKGIVYDTGGMSLKPANYMSGMKADMSGAATVAATICAIAEAKLPVHVIGLIPATDNRTHGNAYVPDDIIEMYDGTTVEVVNTDAEGRLILADALLYAKKYDPEIVIDAATLTGAAMRAIGNQGAVGMNNRAGIQMTKLVKAGEDVYERVVEFPLWDEYKEMIKSEVADLKNVGGSTAGAITAGKFLEYFTDYPFIHLDIAGVAHIDKKDSYRGVGATGFGVRLLFRFLQDLMEK